MATIFEMPIWHPTNKAEVDTFLDAKVNVYVLQLHSGSVGSSITLSFAGAWMWTTKPVYLFNEKLVHLVDDIFWYMSFRNTEHADKVLS